MTQTPSAPPEAPDEAQPADADEHTEHHEHPSDRQYVKIALILGALTALEVATYFESVHHLGDAALYALLIVLMVVKFIYVVAWFMPPQVRLGPVAADLCGGRRVGSGGLPRHVDGVPHLGRVTPASGAGDGGPDRLRPVALDAAP